MAINNCVFEGNLGNDVQTGVLPNGTAKAEFSLATSHGYGDKKKTTWVRCEFFGKRAESGLIPYLVKGKKVIVTGSMYLDEWDKDGEKHSMVKLAVSDLSLAGDTAQAPQPQAAPAQDPQASQNDPFADETIPF